MQATIAGTDAERVAFWSALIRDRRIAPALGLGFTSGMPFLLDLFDASGLADRCGGVPLATIGLLSELTLAYASSAVPSAPFLDQYDPPLIGSPARAAAAWLIVAILAVMAMLAGIAVGDPGHWIWWTVGFSFALGIAGATLDLVLDGWRITSVRPPEKQAVLSSWTEIGWRIGNLAAGAGALYLADHIGWKGAYLGHGGPGCWLGSWRRYSRPNRLRLGALLAACWLRRDDLGADPRPPQTSPARMAVAILLVVAGFRMPGYIASAMAVPLFKHQALHEHRHRDRHQGLRLLDRAWRHLLMAGWLIPRIGMMSSLLIGMVAGLRPRISRSRLQRMAGMVARRSGPSRWRSASRVCLRLRVDRAHHLHVDARVSGACGEPASAC